jgi:ATP-dependent RNA helicase RhlE
MQDIDTDTTDMMVAAIADAPEETAGFDALGLEPDLLKAVAKVGYETPTSVQREAIPLGLAGKDIVGSAQTGTGKTAAFMLPIIQRLVPGKGGVLRALVLVPTRELAEQVLQNARAYGRYTDLKFAAVYGGVQMGAQTRAFRQGVDVVVATPGRLLDHMGRGHVDARNLEVLVLDEADRMLDMGFAPDVHKIIDAVPVERQTMLFSATISRDVDHLARHAMEGHVAIEIGRRAEAAAGVQHVLVAVDRQKKAALLSHMLHELPPGRTLIFARTKFGTERLAHELERLDHDVIALHGGKTQEARMKALERFKSGQTRILVATDVAARGIDVDDIVMVVNYDVPNDPEVYVHRVGRTARAGAEGIGLTLMSPDEWLMMRDIEKLMGRVLRREVVPGFEPAVPPAQPEAKEVRKSGRTIGPRGGKSRGGRR